MRKTIEEVIKVLKEIAVDIHDGKLPQHKSEQKIAGVAIALENFIKSWDNDLNEKLDFLIFMASKRVNLGAKTFNREIIIAGETLFKQWREAKRKASQPATLKPLPNEEESMS